MNNCCNNPEIKSSTYSDYCVNCGWQFDYINNEESYDSSNIDNDNE